MRNTLLAGLLAALGGLLMPAAASAQYPQVIGTRGADPSLPTVHGYYSPAPGVLYSPFANPPAMPAPGRGFGGYNPGFYGGGFVSPSYNGFTVTYPTPVYVHPGYGGFRRR